ncbi:MAG: SAM-dependent methyltransferase [Ponticaulis sp.]|nr:SAM-dependent methyltransferase [Ponticaulis sp.]|tara:strand:- start:198179 stop:198817 length:639 start_codon:yes stop_codon:yes gene_type:complete
MTGEMTKQAGFWDKMADKYNARPVADEEIYQKKLQLTQAFLTKEMKVLEFGCGTGSTAIHHAPYVKHILATDVSDGMLAHGRRKAAAAGLSNISFERHSIEDFPEHGETFDVVLGLNILHLCREPHSVVQKVRRLLKPGGLFVQSTPCLKDFGVMIKLFIPVMQAIGKAPPVSYFSSDELHRMMDAEGFHTVEEYLPDGNNADFIIAQRGLD